FPDKTSIDSISWLPISFSFQNLTMISLSWGPLSIIIHSKNVLTLFRSYANFFAPILFVNCGITT
ncbi:hypothetical protein, partial [Chryseosolibacter indicus]